MVEMWTACPELQNWYPGDPGNPDNIWAHSEGVWNHPEKSIERMEACLDANGTYFEKENVKFTALENEDDVNE